MNRAELETAIAAQRNYIAELTSSISDLQAELTAAGAWLADLEAQLAALPPDQPEWDATAVAHSFLDGFGCRKHAVDEWEARTGLKARKIGWFTNARPFTHGDWGSLPPQVLAGTARASIQFSVHPGSRPAAQRTLARCRADEQVLLDWGVRRKHDAKIRRAAEGLRPWAEVLDRITLRGPGSEENSPWEADGYYLPATKLLPTAQAEAVSRDLAVASRGVKERVMQVFYETLGPDLYSKLTWATNLSGMTCFERAEHLAEMAWAVDVPPGTKRILTSDDYVSKQHEVDNLRRHLAALDRLVAELPGCLAVGIDEWGPHNDSTQPKAVLDALVPHKLEWLRLLVGFGHKHAAAGTWDGACGFETILVPRKVSTVLFADRRQDIGDGPRHIVLKGRENASFTAANGELVPSNDPELASEFLRLVDQLKQAAGGDRWQGRAPAG